MTRLLTTAVILTLAGTGQLEATPPNVVILLSDDQAWSDYSFLNHPAIKTPHIDKLAGQSAVFTRGYTPMSLCRPSLMTIITGLYPRDRKSTRLNSSHLGIS